MELLASPNLTQLLRPQQQDEGRRSCTTITQYPAVTQRQNSPDNLPVNRVSQKVTFAFSVAEAMAIVKVRLKCSFASASAPEDHELWMPHLSVQIVLTEAVHQLLASSPRW